MTVRNVAIRSAVRYSVAVAHAKAELREFVTPRLSMAESLDVIGHAANGVEAINLARDRRPDLMTFDHEMAASRQAEPTVDLKFAIRRDSGIAARRSLLAIGGNGTWRAFNRTWSHRPTKLGARALDLFDSRLVAGLPES